MRRSRIPAIFVHSRAGNRSRVSSGTFFVASPIISVLRTKARLSTSSWRNDSHVVCVACADRNSASRRISRSNSTVVGCIADGWQNQPGLRFGERFVRDEIHAAVQKFFQPFVQCEEIVISALRVVELDIHIHIAVVTFLAACKRAEYAEPARTEREQFRKMSLDDRQRIHRRGRNLSCAGSRRKMVAECRALKPDQNDKRGVNGARLQNHKLVPEGGSTLEKQALLNRLSNAFSQNVKMGPEGDPTFEKSRLLTRISCPF